MSHCVDDALEIMTHAKIRQYHTIIGTKLQHAIWGKIIFFFCFFFRFFLSFILKISFFYIYYPVLFHLTSFFFTLFYINNFSSLFFFLTFLLFIPTFYSYIFFSIHTGWSLGAQAALSLCSGTPSATQNLFLLNPSTGNYYAFYDFLKLPSWSNLLFSFYWNSSSTIFCIFCFFYCTYGIIFSTFFSIILTVFTIFCYNSILILLSFIFYFYHFFPGTTLHYALQSICPFPPLIRQSVSNAITSLINFLVPIIKTTVWDTLKKVTYSTVFRIVLEVSAFLGGFPPEQPVYFHSYMRDVFHTRWFKS